MRGTYNQGRVNELVQNFKVWREERVSGVRAFMSKYDRVGVMICRWLFQSLHDTNAVCVFDYILPLMVRLLLNGALKLSSPPNQPELFRFTEGLFPFSLNCTLFSFICATVSDNDELVNRANLLLVRMCGVSPPRSLVNPLLDAIFEAIQTSPVRLTFVAWSCVLICGFAVMESTIEGPSSGSR